MAAAMDEEPSQHGSTMSLSLGDTEAHLMTPPRQRMSDTFHWTPTMNLKLLLKAASPDLRSREVSQSTASVTVPNVAVARERSMHPGADMKTADEYAENVAVSVDKRRRKDKSLGLLCERYHNLIDFVAFLV